MAKQVFITGGSGDLGAAMVTAFAAADYLVHFTYYSNESSASVLETNGLVKKWRVDGESPALPDLPIDIVINNAGVNYTMQPAVNVDLRDYMKTFEINFYFALKVCMKYIPNMVNNGFGRIININSIYGLVGCDGHAPYICSKHALSGLTKALAHDYGPSGVTANEICPGPVESRLLTEIGKNSGEDLPEYLNDIIGEIPVGRLAQPANVANCALFLAADGAGHVNGTTIRLDGGQLA